MVTQEAIQGRWNEIQGKIRSKWGQITSDELSQVKGNVDQLVGLIQRKSGEAKEHIEHYLSELTSNGSETFAQAAEAVREYSHQAAEAVQHTSQQAAEGMKQGYEEAERMVRQKPVESMVVVFGTGLLVGVVLGLISRGRA